MKEEKIVCYILALAENFQHKLSPELIEIWLKLLGVYTPEQVHDGVIKLICESTSKKFPPFGDLKQAIENVAGILSGEKMLRMAAESEWHKLIELVRATGRYAGPPESLHCTTQYALRACGGWKAACSWTESELYWRKREFMDTWVQAYGWEAALEQGADAVMELGVGGASHEGLVRKFVTKALKSGPTLAIFDTPQRG